MALDPDPGSDDPLGVRGVLPPSITAFDDDGAIDEASTRTHARFLVDAGVHGLVPLGSNGEFPLLAGRERDRVVEIVADEVDGAVPVLAGVGAPSTRVTVERAERAAAAGADGLVVVTPYYYPVGDDALVAHYRRVADAVECPIYAYNIPKRTGNGISLDALDELAAIDGLAGLKDSSEDVGWLSRAAAAHPELTFVAGSDDLLYASLLHGCSGLVSAVANVFPELVVALYEAAVDGDREAVRDRQQQVHDVAAALRRDTLIPGVKAALALRGFDVGPPRRPLEPFDESATDALADRLRELHDEDELDAAARISPE